MDLGAGAGTDWEPGMNWPGRTLASAQCCRPAPGGTVLGLPWYGVSGAKRRECALGWGRALC